MTLRGHAADKQNRSFPIHPLSQTELLLAPEGSRRTEEAQGLPFPLLRKGCEERTELRLPLLQLLLPKCWRREELLSKRDKVTQSQFTAKRA